MFAGPAGERGVRGPRLDRHPRRGEEGRVPGGGREGGGRGVERAGRRTGQRGRQGVSGDSSEEGEGGVVGQGGGAGGRNDIEPCQGARVAIGVGRVVRVEDGPRGSVEGRARRDFPGHTRARCPEVATHNTRPAHPRLHAEEEQQRKQYQEQVVGVRARRHVHDEGSQEPFPDEDHREERVAGRYGSEQRRAPRHRRRGEREREEGATRCVGFRPCVPYQSCPREGRRFEEDRCHPKGELPPRVAAAFDHHYRP